MKTKLIYIFLLSLFIVGCSSTKKSKQTENKSMKIAFDRNAQPKPGPAPKINLGEPKTFTLDNGLKVLVVENHKLPRVSATLTIDNEPLFEGEKAGVSSLLSSLLGTGTTHISKDEFNERIDFLGAYLSYGSQSARMSSLSKFFPEVFKLMADGALYPVFSKEEFDKEVAKTIDGIKSGEKSVTNIAHRVENLLAFGKNHPYGEYTSVETIKNVQLKDVKKLYDTYFKPNNAYLVVVGDVDFNDVKKLVTENFAFWKKGTPPKTQLPEPKNVAQTEIDFIDMPESSQTQIDVLSTTKLTMNNPDYFAVLVANQILGGDFNSYLNMNLREAHGFTYGARSSLRADKYISKFTAGAKVRNSVADSAIVETMKEIHRIRTEKVDEETLKNVKAGYTGKFVMTVEKPETVAKYALNIEKNNLPKDFYKNYLKNINAVTAEDVLRVAQRYFSEDNVRIVVTSKGLEVIPALEKMGYPINYYDKKGNPTQKPKMIKAVASDVTPQSVLNHYYQAVGGKEKLENIQSIEQTYEMEMQGMALEQTFKMEKPNKLYVETKMMGQTAFKMVFDGQNGYMEQMGAKMPMPEDQLAEIKKRKGLFDELYLLDENKKVTLDGIINIDDKEVYLMNIVDGDNKEIKYFEVKSGLLVKSEKTAKDQNGKEITVPTSYVDYKAVEGILIPHTVKTKAMGQDMEMKLKDIKFNVSFPADTFK